MSLHYGNVIMLQLHNYIMEVYYGNVTTLQLCNSVMVA